MTLIEALQQHKWAMQRDVLLSLSNIILRHDDGIKLEQAEIDAIAARHGDSDDDSDVRMVGNIAVVPITGVISKGARSVDRISQPRGTSTGEIQMNLSRALDNDSVSAVLLDIDSPGGTVAGIEATSNFIFKSRGRKPIIAFIGDLGASAAWWLASQADLVVAMEGASIGSIGVFSVVIDSSEAAKQQGVRVMIIGSGSLKGMGQPGTAITKEHRTELQKSVDDTNGIFIAHVAKGRGLTTEQVEAVAGGGTFRGVEALSNLMIDQVGSFEDAISLAERRISNPDAKVGTQIEHSQLCTVDLNITAVEVAEPIHKKGEAMTTENKAVEAPATVNAGIETDGGAVATLRVEKTLVPHVTVPVKTGLSDADKKAITETERLRSKEIRALGLSGNMTASWIDERVDSGVTLQQVRNDLLDEKMKADVPVAVVVGESMISNIAPDMEDALFVRAGNELAKPRPGHSQFVGLTLTEMGRAFLCAHGLNAGALAGPQVCREIFRLGMNGNRIGALQAAGGAGYGHSTSDFPLILENTFNKRLLAAFVEASQTWSQIFTRRSAKDFKNMKSYRLGEVALLPSVKEGEPYDETTLGETREQYAVAKFGTRFALTWETMVNDDLEAFSRVPTLMGNAASRTVNQQAFLPITTATNGETMADGVTLFHANHKNLIASGTVLSVASLGLARKTLRLQTGVNASVILNMAPKFLLIPAALETVAEQLISSLVDPTKSNATPNPFANKLQIITETLLDADSSTAWYLLADPKMIPTIEVAFLEGEEGPRITQEDGFNVDGRSYKVRLVVGAKAIDHRGVIKNPGT